MQEWLINFGTHHAFVVYALIVILACAEGPILSMIFGVLLKLGYFSFIPVYAALMLGDLIGDAVWYWIGRRFGRAFVKRFGKYFSVDEKSVTKVEQVFHANKYRILLISKMTNGFGFALATLITAGMIRIPFWRYMTTNLIGQFVWSGSLLAVGYFFGNLYVQVGTVLGRISIGALFVVVCALFIGYTKYLRTRAQQ